MGALWALLTSWFGLLWPAVMALVPPKPQPFMYLSFAVVTVLWFAGRVLKVIADQPRLARPFLPYFAITSATLVVVFALVLGTA
jgi:hypothetical protein